MRSSRAVRRVLLALALLASALAAVDAARAEEPLTPATARIVGARTQTIAGVAARREWGYLKMRDGIELAFEVVRPDDAVARPLLLTYDGYDAGSNPDAAYIERYLPKGYAFMGLSLRGTGCSGGVFDFFQPAEGPDGWQAIEWAAAQAWSNGRVGMVGKSYPGITQLFVAETQPPHLTAIAPGHYFADAYRDVAFPGGILNYAFASLWSFISQPAPGYQAAFNDSMAGDQTCAAHQRHHADNLPTNPFVQALQHPYDDPLLAERSPLTHADKIQVPVFQALAWQDEQLASRQTHLLSRFEELGIPYRAVVSNGDHGMYRRTAQLAELDRFFEAHVKQSPVLSDGTTRDAYLAEPPVSVWWEQGGPSPRWRTTLASWRDKAAPWRLHLGADGALAPGAPTDAVASDAYAHSAAGSQGVSNPRYATLPYDNFLWDDVVPPKGAALAYTSAPLAADTALLGSASADLWITATAPNVDLQVTLTEVRPDGQEVYVQQGWLRARQRALDPAKSSPLLPFQTHQRADVADVPALEPTLARVEVFPFGHFVRAGSRLRLWIEAPTVLPQLWGFALDPTPAAVQIWRDAAHPSSLVLPVAGGHAPPAGAAGLPGCGTVLRQPCRPDPLG